jgi:TonB-linked SusC/RagA family outer membrane protein
MGKLIFPIIFFLFKPNLLLSISKLVKHYMNKFYILFISIILTFSYLPKVNGESFHFAAKTEKSNDNQKIKGKVIDAKTGESIIGATIAVKGTTSGTITDIDGNFSISVPDTNAILVVSYVGYNQQELPVKNKTEITVDLNIKTTELDQVVVIGYGVQKKVDLMGAVSSVGSKDIANTPVTDITQAIQGRAAGVDVVSNSGSPGGAISIKIRGTGTVNNSDPLYVVDGMIVESISYLNSEDIKDIQILKDASSAAIYGARAANGVVIVTTKKGEKGMHVSYSSYWGTSQFWNKPDILNKAGFKNLYESVHGAPLINSPRDSIFYNKYAANNWLNYITRTGSNQKYNVQLSGGNENNTYLVSGSYSGDNGVVQKTGFTKQDVRIYSENKLMKNLTLRSSLQATGSDRTLVQEGEYNIFQYALNAPPVNSIYDISKLYMIGDSVASFNKLMNQNATPYGRLVNTDLEQKTSGYIGNFELFTQITNDLTNSTRAGFDMEYFSESDFSGINLNEYAYYTNGGLGIDYNQNAVQQTNNNKAKWQFEDILTYNKKFGKNTLSLIGGISFEGYSETDNFAARAMTPDVISSLQFLDATYVNPQISGSGSGWKSAGIPFRLDYNYAEKYLLQFNIRADASSLFTSDKRWGEFPSVSAGWKLNEESFFKDINWLTLLKVRASWGLAGNNRIPQYASETVVQTYPSYYYVLGAQPFYKPGWTSSGIGNPNITWEKTDSKNIGIDVSLFKGSLSGSLEAFNKVTSNMLLQVPVVLSSGMNNASPWQNAGEVKNAGFEIATSYKKSIDNFSFEAGFNFTKIYNTVLKTGSNNEPILGGYQDIYSANPVLAGTYLTETAVGHSIGEFYGWKIDKSIEPNGIWHAKDMPTIAGRALPTSSNLVQAGDYIFKDLNGDGRIDESDKTFLGSPLPNFTYGLNFYFKYKIVDLTMFFQGVYGNKIFNVEKYWVDAFHSGPGFDVNSTETQLSNDNNVSSSLAANSYTAANENAKYPVIKNATVDNNVNYRASDFYIEDGSYLRLKNLQLGLNLPHDWIVRLKMTNLRVYASAYNLLTFTKYSGLDPEIGNQTNTATVGAANTTTSNTGMGIDIGTYPQARTYTFGILVDF